jgi:hypothetical protein
MNKKAEITKSIFLGALRMALEWFWPKFQKMRLPKNILKYSLDIFGQIVFSQQNLGNGMSKNLKPIIVVATLSGLLCQTAHAQLIESGTSILAPTTPPIGGIGVAPEEYITVSWSVVLNSGVYTYAYQVNNPAGDVLENNDGSLTTTPEIVDAFQLNFNTLITGAVVGGPTGGIFTENNGVDGLQWFLSPVAAGTSSPWLSFQSDLPLTLGNANAQDSDPPSPWASTAANGQQVPIPNTVTPVPEPMTTTLLALTGLLLLPFRSNLGRFLRQAKASSR